MKRASSTIGFLVAVAVCLSALSGCSRRTGELEAELARLQKENAELKKEIGKVVKLSSAIQEVLKSYEELAPQMDEIQREIDATRDYVSKIEALTPKGMNPRARAELKLLIEEVMAEEQQRRQAEQRRWAEDLWERHLDELVALAHLSPVQKKQIAQFMKEEQQQVRMAYSQLVQGTARVEDIDRAKENALATRDKKVKAILAPDQYKKYEDWKRERDMFRAGINRRQQSPNANQDDL
ncbi:MAG: hypothetical protein GXP25_05550 [Planctomycetes bacterium]|nr:hypothetical protein [Planctomycetota bacterium]